MLNAMNESSPIEAAQAASVAAGPATSSVGVLVVNLGTPDTADVPGVRRYLKEFLSDPRVIENQGLVWQLALNGVILPLRPRIKAKDYQKIWNVERNESPLKTITRAQAEKLAARLARDGCAVVVDWAMRYGSPAVAGRIQALLQEGCDRILLVPLYPQYSAATSATACDHAFRALMDMRWQPAIRVSPPYHDDPVYIDAVVSAMKRDVAALSFEPEVILVSFHGVPKSYLLKGDPYHCHCVKTYRLKRDAFGWPAERFRMSFQSRFGPAKWLQPYTDETVKGLAESGVKRRAVVAPGFSADCLETLEELNVENRHIFTEHGGEDFAYLPCLNDGEEGLRVIQSIVARELRGWIDV